MKAAWEELFHTHTENLGMQASALHILHNLLDAGAVPTEAVGMCTQSNFTTHSYGLARHFVERVVQIGLVVHASLHHQSSCSTASTVK